MKKAVLVLFALSAVMAFAQKEISLASARARIGEAISNPAVMTSTVKSLSAGDQIAFLAEVNSAIAKMPGSNEDRAAAYLNANRAAFRGAAKGNLVAMIAECFATAPVEVLPILNERFAKDVLNRSSGNYSDEVFTRVSERLVSGVNKRLASAPDGAIRSAFAIMMMVNASNGSPADLAEKLVGTLPAESRDVVGGLLPAAADGNTMKQAYEKAVGASSKPGEVPAVDLVLRLAGPQLSCALLSDVIHNVAIVDEVFKHEENMFVPVVQQGNTVVPPSEPEGYQYQD